MTDHPETMDGAAGAALDARFRLQVDPDSIGRLCREHGLAFPVVD